MGTWYHGVNIIVQISKQHFQLAYSGLEMLLQLEWNYLQITVPKVATMMGPIKEALIETFFPALFGGG